MISRRTLLAGTASAAAAQIPGIAWAETKPPLAAGLPSGVASAATLEALPGKKPLIKLSYRPPNYETPMSVFEDVITPNDSFFVRWHLADIPEIDAANGRSRSAARRRQTPDSPSTISRTTSAQPSSPRYANARAIGAGCRPACPGRRMGLRRHGQRELEGRAAEGHPGQGRACPTERSRSRSTAPTAPARQDPRLRQEHPPCKALDDNTLIAYEMNGAPLPHFNGFPARLIVPGWTAPTG